MFKQWIFWLSATEHPNRPFKPTRLDVVHGRQTAQQDCGETVERHCRDTLHRAVQCACLASLRWHDLLSFKLRQDILMEYPDDRTERSAVNMETVMDSAGFDERS